MENTQFFIGMGTFEDLLDLQLPLAVGGLFLNSKIETLPTSHPSIRYRKFSVMAARIEGGICHYWQTPTGDVQDWGVGDTDDKLDAANKRTLDALDLLNAYATTVRGFRITKALVATPKDYSFLDGTTELIRYDKDADTYRGTAASGHEDPEPEVS